MEAHDPSPVLPLVIYFGLVKISVYFRSPPRLYPIVPPTTCTWYLVCNTMVTEKGTDFHITAIENTTGEMCGDVHTLDFGGESKLPPPPTLTKAEEKRLYRKIDIRLMPILALMYLLSFLDRGGCDCLKSRCR